METLTNLELAEVIIRSVYSPVYAVNFVWHNLDAPWLVFVSPAWWTLC